MSIENLGNKITTNLFNDKSLYHLKYILEEYNGIDWLYHINFSQIKYTRTILYVNDVIEIILICWEKGQKSKIHDHPNRGCLLKVLDGSLTENNYNENIKFFHSKILCKNDIGFKESDKILHSICANEKTVSLHIYAPPNYTPRLYDENIY